MPPRRCVTCFSPSAKPRAADNSPEPGRQYLRDTFGQGYWGQRERFIGLLEWLAALGNAEGMGEWISTIPKPPVYSPDDCVTTTHRPWTRTTFNPLIAEPNGSRADFHLHTIKDPGKSSKFRAEYAGRENSFPKDWIARLKEKNIRVAVVTNHNLFDREDINVCGTWVRRKTSSSCQEWNWA